jgi:hypothetical protein
MSKVQLQGNVSGTGVFTIASPNSNTDRTLTLPDATGTVQVSGNPISGTTANFSGNVTLGSSVLATPTGSAPSYLCRAWVNFNGQSTPSIRASGNVSSVTKQSTGNYTVNFTTAMPDTSYAAVGGKSNITATHVVPGVNLYANISNLIMQVYESNGSFADSQENFVAVFR